MAADELFALHEGTKCRISHLVLDMFLAIKKKKTVKLF